MRRTKIIATYGPAISSAKRVSRLVSAGVNVFRINCAHGKTDDFLAAARIIRSGCQKADWPVGLLMDIAGPKLRLNRFDGEMKIKGGDTITLTSGRTDLRKHILGVNHPAVIRSLRKGHRVFIDDGQIEFKVISGSSKKIVAKAINGGSLRPGKGINVPDSNLRIPTIGDKDREDIKTAVRLECDYIALSFVRSVKDLTEARRIIKKFGGRQRIIAKLEKKEAVDNLEEIIKATDGIMVARGDLGVELPPPDLPPLQKRIISLAHRCQKPVIVATQMLESMRFQPRATRAEINDVATAAFDLVDAVMLSAETATGKYPREAVEMMAKVVVATEDKRKLPAALETAASKTKEIPQAIADAVARTTDDSGIKAIFAFTTTGFTAQLISRLFPDHPIIALTPDNRVRTQLSLYCAVYPKQIDQPKSFDDMLKTVDQVGRQMKLTSKGDKVIITGGAPFGSTVPTNFMMFYQMGKKR
jgi:pyruvate kinase